MTCELIFRGIVFFMILNMSACGGSHSAAKLQGNIQPTRTSADISMDSGPETPAPVIPDSDSPPEAAADTGPEPEADTFLLPAILGPSVLTPRLEAIVNTLKAIKGQSVNIQQTLAGIENDVGEKDFKNLPAEGTIEVLEIRKGHLLMAFVSVVENGYSPCGDDAQFLYELRIVRDKDGQDRISLDYSPSDILLQGQDSLEVVFPEAASQLPVFEVRYGHQSAGCSGFDVKTAAKAYHMAKKEPITNTVFIDMYEYHTGETTHTVSKLVWIAGQKPDTAFLVEVSLVTYEVSPCTGDDDLADYHTARCREQVECERTTTMLNVTADDVFDVSPEEIAELRKTERRLAKLPPDIKSSSSKVCRRARDFGI